MSSFKAALHVHTTSSDGARPLYEVVEEHYRRGFDILVITDHDVLTRSWVTAPRALSRDRFAEIAAGFGRGGRAMLQIPDTNEQSIHDHINTFMVELNNSPTVQNTLQVTQTQNGLCHFNHPGRYPRTVAQYVDWFMNHSNCVGLEIINQDDRYVNDRVLWDNVLAQTIPQGRYVWGFSNDDSHGHNQIGFSFNMFQMRSNTVAQFRAAMHTGSFYAVARVARPEGVNNPNRNAVVPVINDIVRDTSSITIAAEHYDRIDWIGEGSQKIGEGSTIALAAVTGSFVRANVIGPGGIAFTQPFGV